MDLSFELHSGTYPAATFSRLSNLAYATIIFSMRGPSKERRLTRAGTGQLFMGLSFKGATTEYGEDQIQQG